MRDSTEKSSQDTKTSVHKMTGRELFYEIAGWYGMLAVLASYFLVSFDMISAQGWVYQLLNLTGALGLMIIALHKKVWQSVSLNIVWILIGSVAIIQLLK